MRIGLVKRLLNGLLIASCVLAGCGHSPSPSLQGEGRVPFDPESYPDLLDLHYTPGKMEKCQGWFTDEGSWFGFTLPETANPKHGFCGPFDLDERHRDWISDAILEVEIEPDGQTGISTTESHYYPGELRLEYHSGDVPVRQKLQFLRSDLAMITIESKPGRRLSFHGRFSEGWKVDTEDKRLIINKEGRDAIIMLFPDKTELETNGKSYKAFPRTASEYRVLIGFGREPEDGLDYDSLAKAVEEKWMKRLEATIREDMPERFNRVAIKSLVTLVSNYKSPKDGLHHGGVVPSQGVDYFMGFWAWDSWKHAAAMASFAPDEAMEQVRAMFDYQTPEGMVPDCIYPVSQWNNYRNSKPPLAAWAVLKIFEQNGDKDFVTEMLPKLVSYHEWWYRYRDCDNNGFCEYGSCDGTLEAAAWESGMDNAVRFDRTSMVEGAYSMDQESVDLNAFLLFERQCLEKLREAVGSGTRPDIPETAWKLDGEAVCNWFFDPSDGFFHDRKIPSGEFIKVYGTEAAIPLWTGMASKDQADAVIGRFTDSSKFATFIPFPTLSADDPSFEPEGYWRGPVWLDQAYFAISGIRRYSHADLADKMTADLFDRLQGLEGDGQIHENYVASSGKALEAPHFSWSAASLLMLYREYGKNF